MSLSISEIAIKESINTVNFINTSNAGFIPTDKDFFIISLFNILKHTNNIFDDLKDCQKSNVVNTYNVITLNP